MPRLTSISNKIVTTGAKRDPVFIKVFTGTDFSAFHSTWTFSTGTLSLRSSTLPYHSYGNDMDLFTATNQLCNKTWPLRAGIEVQASTSPFSFEMEADTVQVFNTSSFTQSTEVYFVTTITSNISVNQPIIFENSFGGVTPGETYFIKSIDTVSNYVFISSTLGGSIKTLRFPGTNYATTVGITSASTNIGYWMNGVNMYDPSAGTEAPRGFLSFPNLSYNAAYQTTLEYSYSLEQDRAGGRTIPNGAYIYHDFSFADAWTTGSAHVGTGSTVVTTGTAEISLISYYSTATGGLRHLDGHSKILGWSLDGYPVYGPYGYNQPLDRNSGTRPMRSGYVLETKTSNIEGRVRDGVLDTFSYPLGIFVQDYYFSGGGDLDISNGRFCITPDYPTGTYAYFCTVDSETLKPVYPYIIGNVFKSTPVAAGQTQSDPTDGGGSSPKQTI
jgi:hypothetical protein